jgi:hypothetical protein
VTFPHPDIWLRPVLDQKLVGSDWHFVFDDFQEMIRDHGLYFHAWPMKHWALSDESREDNERALRGVPEFASVHVRKANSGADASIAFEDMPIYMRSLGTQEAHKFRGVYVNAEIGHCPGSRTYNLLVTNGKLVRYPYEIPGMRPHVFLLVCPEHQALQEKQTLRAAALHPRA